MKKSAKSKTKFKGLKIGTKTTKNPFETATYLDLVEKGIEVGYETHKFEYTVSHNYIPDFPIVLGSGTKIFIETKGNGRSWTPEVRRKMVTVKQTYPDLDIRFLFYTNAPFGGKRKDGSRMTQGEWADKYGFPWAVKKVPPDWLT